MLLFAGIVSLPGAAVVKARPKVRLNGTADATKMGLSVEQAGPKQLLAAAEQAGRYEDAIRLLRLCLEQKPTEKKCQASLEESLTQYRRSMDYRVNRTPGRDLPRLKVIYDEWLQVEPLSPLVAARRGDVSDGLVKIRQDAEVFIASVHRGGSPLLPKLLFDYAAFVPEAQEADREANLHATIAEALAQSGSRREVAGLQLLEDYVQAVVGRAPSDEIGLAQSALLLDASRGLETLSATSLRQVDFVRLDALVEVGAVRLNDQAAQGLEQFKGSLSAAVTRLVVDELGGVATNDPAVRRVMRATLIRANAPNVARLSGRPWSEDLLASDSEALQVAKSTCPIGGSTIQGASIPLERIQGVSVRLTVVGCTAQEQALERQPLASKYIAGSLQSVNADYLTLQRQLAQANQNLITQQIRNAQSLIGVAEGWGKAAIQIGNATSEAILQNEVSKLSKKLAATTPMVSVPDEQAYLATKISGTLVVTFATELEIEDKAFGLVDSLPVQFGLRVVAHGVEGAFPSDTTGVANRPLKYPPDSEIASSGMSGLSAELQRMYKQLGQRVLINRGIKMAQNGKDLSALGNFLMARDWDSKSEVISSYQEILEQADSLTLDRLKEFRLNPNPFGPKPVLRTDVKKAPVRATAPKSASATSGTAMVQAAVANVVAIRVGNSRGSGFAIRGSGLILTNAHVVSSDSRPVITTSNGDVFLGSVIQVVTASDLALIRVPGMDLPGLDLAGPGEIEVGAELHAIGAPLGLQSTVTRGIVSGIRKIDGRSWIQFDAAINPGNSGGPIILSNGKVAGIVTMKRSVAEALGFALSADEIRTFVAGFMKVSGPIYRRAAR